MTVKEIVAEIKQKMDKVGGLKHVYFVACGGSKAAIFPGLYLLQSEAIDPDDKKVFLELKAGTASEAQVGFSLNTLMRMMESYYRKPVILLLDEYDVPLAKASSNGYYKEMLSVIKGMMSTALKDNQFLKFAIITGCLKIAKESIFTGLNNFKVYSITNMEFDETFGFTDAEVREMLQYYELIDKYEEVKEWYDGYLFGSAEIYNPWSVINYISKGAFLRLTGYIPERMKFLRMF